MYKQVNDWMVRVIPENVRMALVGLLVILVMLVLVAASTVLTGWMFHLGWNLVGG